MALTDLMTSVYEVSPVRLEAASTIAADLVSYLSV